MRVRVDTNALRREAEARLAEAQEDYAQAIRAIELIERRYTSSQPSTTPSPSGTSTSVGSVRPSKTVANGGLRDLIIGFLAHCPQGATLKEIADVALKHIEGLRRIQVARTLYKLKKGNQVQLIRRQVGNVPGLYALPDHLRA